MAASLTDPLPPEARLIVRDIAAELHRFPKAFYDDPQEVGRLIRRTAGRLDGVTHLDAPRPIKSHRPAISDPGTKAGDVKVEVRRAIRMPASR